MMDIMTVAEDVRAMVQELTGKEVIINKIEKNNGMVLTGLTIGDSDEKVRPTIYLDSFADKGMSVQEISKAIADSYEAHKGGLSGVDLRNILTKDYILSNVFFKLVNGDMNNNSPILFKEFLDLKAQYVISVNDGNEGCANITVKKEIIDNAGIDLAELEDAAYKNTMNTKYEAMSIMQMITGLGYEPEVDAFDILDDAGMVVITNENKIFGANVMMFTDTFKELSNKTGTDLVVLPSSIHEIICVKDMGQGYDNFKNMVTEINDTQVAREEVLSYSIYKYSASEDKLSVVA